MTLSVVVATDGGARGNPGPAAIGAVIWRDDDEGGDPLSEVSERIGIATNNVAEYKAVIAGLIAAKSLGAGSVHLKSDSQLVIEQLAGRYRVKSSALRPLWLEATRLIDDFERTRLSHVRRHLNKHADALVNAALDA